jgi:hypothetical protein
MDLASFFSGCHCERGEAISQPIYPLPMGIASSLRSSQ